MNYRFPKQEHLCSRRLIERLHVEGRRLMVFPYSVRWMPEPSIAVPCQVLIVAPKRRFHHAVDRNRVKRLTRECYRHLKPQLYDLLQRHNLRLVLSLTYIHNEPFDFERLAAKLAKLIVSLESDIIAYEEDIQPDSSDHR